MTPSADTHDCPTSPDQSCASRQRCIQIRWLLAATVFGASFPLFGWLAAMSSSSVNGIGEAHAAQPVLYIVDLAPFVLGVTGYAIGHFHSRLVRIRQSIEQTVRTRTAELQNAMDTLSATQAELLNAQKLEAIGGLAAGIAHEINTPIQYISDNTRFVEQSLTGLLSVASAASHLADAVRDVSEVAGIVEAYNAVADQADVEFLSEEVPGAIEESLEGIGQVASIVKALKSFAHPGSTEKVEEDLNELITVTCAVARGEWKNVAEMDLSGLDSRIPKVPILAGPIKQVVLNVVVNAAHAIEERITPGERGAIRVSTFVQDDDVVIKIADDGAGIPASIQDRILEPFFTTKDVGKGSGQGLAIAHSVIEEHGGNLSFESTPGEGTTFLIALPFVSSEAPAIA